MLSARTVSRRNLTSRVLVRSRVLALQALVAL